MLVIGAGPAGLYAAYYAGFRGLSVGIMDSLPELGGQVSALYPEKLIFDVAGLPAIKGQDLVDALAEQAASADPSYFLGHRAEDLHLADDHVTVTTDHKLVVQTRTVLITGGIGTFSPRPLACADGYEGGGLMYFVPRLDELAGLDVLIVGGGDSAFDWAMSLEPRCRSVVLVHRRAAFRAHKRTVQQVLDSSVRVLTPYEVAKIHGHDHRRRRGREQRRRTQRAARRAGRRRGPWLHRRPRAVHPVGSPPAQAPDRGRHRDAHEPVEGVRSR